MPTKISLIDDPVLRIPCESVIIGDLTIFIDQLLTDMHQAMIMANGMGLAANQIGHSLRVFILSSDAMYTEYINPVVMSQSDLVPFEGEGCLSIPGVKANTMRYNQLDLVWLDRTGKIQEGHFEGIKAFAVQHEMDHLNGKLYIDQFGPLKRQMIVKKHKKYLRFS